MKRTLITLGLVVLGAATLPSSAFAQNAELYQTHANNSLAYAESEAKLLFGVIAAKVFEPDLSKSTLMEIKKAIADAKKNTDRAKALLDEKQAKIDPEFEKMRETFSALETQLEKTKDIVTEQTKGLAVADEGENLEAKGPAPEKEAVQPDWQAMKDNASWLYLDIQDALKKHRDLAKKLGVTLPTPAKPKAKRE
ncbi:MAG: hypothetical protein HY791_27680 [Deltaproteobacteria bacterium]|nr:hypothetical protein [Deltaproteobacteria bacterium]